MQCSVTNCAATCSQHSEVCGKPWSSSTGSPCPPTVMWYSASPMITRSRWNSGRVHDHLFRRFSSPDGKRVLERVIRPALAVPRRLTCPRDELNRGRAKSAASDDD
jgi:hypothetical protein